MNSFTKYLGMIALALLPILSSAALQVGKVEVGKASGTVTLIDAKALRKPLVSGAVFQEGSKVETGADSSVELVFSNGSSVLLTPNTLLEVRTFRQIASAGIASPYRKMEKDPSPSVTELEVSRGKIIGEARKLNALSVFTVKTPAGMVRVRGTLFVVQYTVCGHEIGHIVVDCIRGSVEATVSGSDAGPVTVDPATQLTSAVAPSSLINSLAKASGAPNSAAALVKISEKGRVMLYPIPTEEMAALAAYLEANSTLPAEVAAIINSMAQAMPSYAQIFGADNITAVCSGGSVCLDGAPVKGFGVVITGSQVSGVATKEDKSAAPAGPTSTTTGGSTTSDGSAPVPGLMSAAAFGEPTTLDASVKKITDNVQRMVEAKQLQVTPSGI
jgi:hypothetical protein